MLNVSAFCIHVLPLFYLIFNNENIIENII